MLIVQISFVCSPCVGLTVLSLFYLVLWLVSGEGSAGAALLASSPGLPDLIETRCLALFLDTHTGETQLVTCLGS